MSQKTFKIKFIPISKNKIKYELIDTKVFCVRSGLYIKNSGILHKYDLVFRSFVSDIDLFIENNKEEIFEIPIYEKWRLGYDPCDIFNPDEEYLDWLGRYIKELEKTDLKNKSTPTLRRLKKKLRYLLMDSHSGGLNYKSHSWYELVKYSKIINGILETRN